MKTILYLILLFLLSALCIGSIAITVLDLVNNRYFKEFNNIKSLNNKEEYMDVDYLLIKQTVDRNENTEEGVRFDIRGALLSNNKSLTLKVGHSKFVNFNSELQPLYKSKLTGSYFLKDAPKKYYEIKYRDLYGAIFLKIAFYFILPLLIYRLIKYIKNRKYRI